MIRRIESRDLRTSLLTRRMVALVFSAAGLLAIGSWCVALLVESLPLRRQLHQHLEWIADLQALRASLSLTTSGTRDENAGRRQAATARLLELTQELQTEGGDSTVRSAAQEMAGRLEHLRGLYGEPLASISPEVWSDAVFGAARSADRMEAALQPQVLELNLSLDEHWSSLNLLLVVTLLLSASNFLFLVMAERRRRELEAARDAAARLLTHDTLTGLLNRDGVLRLLRHELQRCRRRAEALGLVLADIDRFREINVLVGEEQGDILLQQVSQRLGAWVRPYDSIGRIGADSFLILVPGCDRHATASVAERLREMVEKDEVALDRSRVRPLVSLAYTSLDPPEEHDAELLLYRLREALERVQRSGRSAAKSGSIVEVTVDGTGPVPLASNLTIEPGPSQA